jgi:hypothetical protein
MTETRFDVQQLKSDYAPGADVDGQDPHATCCPFGNLIMAAFEESEVDDEQVMQATLPNSTVENGDAPEPTAGETSDVESAPVNEGADRMDGSVDTALLGGTYFAGRIEANNNAQAVVDAGASALTPGVNSSEAPAEPGFQSTAQPA